MRRKIINMVCASALTLCMVATYITGASLAARAETAAKSPSTITVEAQGELTAAKNKSSNLWAVISQWIRNMGRGDSTETPQNPVERASSPDSTTQSTGKNSTTQQTQQPTQQTPGASAWQSSGSMESQVYVLVNEERSKSGLQALTRSSALDDLAQKKAEDLAKNNVFSHNSPTYGSAFDMMTSAGISYSSAGENIARGQRTAASVMSGWMGSAGHRANILNSAYTHIGIGCAKSKSGQIYWVQMFARFR